MEDNIVLFLAMLGIVAVCIVALLVSRRKQKAARAANASYWAERFKQEQEAKASTPASSPAGSPAGSPASAPAAHVVLSPTCGDAVMVYHYMDVRLDAAPGGAAQAKPGEAVRLEDRGDCVTVTQGSALLGRLPHNRLEGMVRDWDKHGDPYLAFVAQAGADGGVMIALAFYRDELGRYLASHPDAKKWRLTGKAEEFADAIPGMRCEVEEDFDHEGRWLVRCEGSLLGALPAGVIRLAEAEEMDVEDLEIMAGEPETDEETGREIYYIYVI